MCFTTRVGLEGGNFAGASRFRTEVEGASPPSTTNLLRKENRNKMGRYSCPWVRPDSTQSDDVFQTLKGLATQIFLLIRIRWIENKIKLKNAQSSENLQKIKSGLKSSQKKVSKAPRKTSKILSGNSPWLRTFFNNFVDGNIIDFARTRCDPNMGHGREDCLTPVFKGNLYVYWTNTGNEWCTFDEVVWKSSTPQPQLFPPTILKTVWFQFPSFYQSSKDLLRNRSCLATVVV